MQKDSRSSPGRNKVRITSLLPLALANDSRTLKIASAFNRAGFSSEVYENAPSPSETVFPEGVRVKTLWFSPAKYFRRITSSGWQVEEGLERQIRTMPLPGRALIVRLKEVLHYSFFICYYLIIRPLLGFVQKPQADIIYLHEYRLFPLAFVWRMLTGAIIVYDAHDYYPEVRDERTLSLFWKMLFLPTLIRIEAACVRNATCVVTTSSGIGKLIKQRFHKDPAIIRNCHDKSYDINPNQGLRQRTGIRQDAFVLGVIGHRKPAQYFSPLLAAISHLNNTGFPTYLVLIGRGYERILTEASEKGIGKFVHSLGAVLPGEIVPLLCETDAVALPYAPQNSHYENALPNGFFQSVAARVPLLYPPLGQITNEIGDEKIGIPFDPRDVEETLTALSKIRTDSRFRSECRCALEAFAPTLDWEHEAQILMPLVEEALSAAKSRK